MRSLRRLATERGEQQWRGSGRSHSIRLIVLRGATALNPGGQHRLDMLGYDQGVAKTADDLRTEVLALPAHDRARIASELLASLDHDAANETEVDELWSIETERRAAMLATGEAGTLIWDEIEQRFAERRAQRNA